MLLLLFFHFDNNERLILSYHKLQLFPVLSPYLSRHSPKCNRVQTFPTPAGASVWLPKAHSLINSGNASRQNSIFIDYEYIDTQRDIARPKRRRKFLLGRRHTIRISNLRVGRPLTNNKYQKHLYPLLYKSPQSAVSMVAALVVLACSRSMVSSLKQYLLQCSGSVSVMSSPSSHSRRDRDSRYCSTVPFLCSSLCYIGSLRTVFYLSIAARTKRRRNTMRNNLIVCSIKLNQDVI